MADLQQLARDHLWMHFTRMGGFGPGQEVPIIVKGDGCYLWDSNGKRYLDALAGLFSVNIGYGYGEEIGQAALEQMRELPFYTNWSYAHPKAIELAAELATLAPGDLNRAFFVSGGSEAVESAWKLARQYYTARGEKQVRHALREPEVIHDAIVAARRGPHRYKAIARHIAYHGTTMGALSINGIPALRSSFEPLVPEVRHVHNTNRYHRPDGETEEDFTRFLLDDLEQAILAMGPETVCLVHMEPVQNAGGCFTPPLGYWQGVRAICDDVRHPALGRRGDHRLRPGRLLVRVRALRHPPGHRHLRQGPLLVVRADRRRPCARCRDGAVPRLDVDVLARRHLRRAPRDVRDRAQEHRDHEARGRDRARPRHRGRRSGPSSRRCSRSRSSATSAAPASSTGSSSSRTARRKPASRITSASRCCAASSPGAVRSRPDLPAGRSRRPGHPDLAAARGGGGGAGRDRRDSRRGARPRRGQVHEGL